MRHFLLSMALAACTVVGAQFIGTSSAVADDVWYANDGGYQMYIVSDSVRSGVDWLNCSVKYVDEDGVLAYIKNYKFFAKGYGPNEKWYYQVGNHGVYMPPGSFMFNLMIRATNCND